MIFKSLLVAVAGIFVLGCAGSMPVPQEDLKFEKVYDMPGLTKDVIYQKSIQFLVHEFVSAKDVIQSQDKESGTILGKGNMRVIFMGITQDKPLDFSIEVWEINAEFHKDNSEKYNDCIKYINLLKKIK